MSGTKVSTPGTCYMLLLLLSSFFSTRHFADTACSPVVGGGFFSVRVMSIQKPPRNPETTIWHESIKEMAARRHAAIKIRFTLQNHKRRPPLFRKKCLWTVLQSEVKVIIFLYFEHFHPRSCIRKHFRTTSTQWKQTVSSTDVITRISAVSSSLPLLPLPSDPLIRPMGTRENGRGEAGWDWHQVSLLYFSKHRSAHMDMWLSIVWFSF